MGFLSGITSFVKEHSAVIHGVLDLAGFIPGVGAVADLANAAVYAVEGDYANAALSVVSAVPGIGDTVALAKKSTKAIKGGVKAMKNMKALTKAKNMKGLFGLLRGKAQAGAKKLAGKFTDMKALYRDLKNGNKKLCLFGKCFTGDTLVYTKKGYVAIKEIRKGDDIYSRDADTGETGFKEVEEVFQTGAHTIYHIWLEGKEELKTTAYHPIYVEERGWVTVINLREGDPVQTLEGTACITKIEKERFEEPVPVYNLHVKDWVSYFVSYMRIFVHNKDIFHSRTERGVAGKGLKGNNWKFDLEKDLDWRGTGKTYRDAFDEAFKRTGFSKKNFEVKRWGTDKYGKSVPVEWKPKSGIKEASGAQVNMDIPEWNNVKPDGTLGDGPHQPHIGYQNAGKGEKRVRGHIFIDEVPATRR